MEKKERKEKINIRMIARQAGVSTATVSRTLRSPEKVRRETREKVLAAVEKYEYAPRQTSPSASNVIAYFVEDIKNVFYAELARSITEYAAADGYYVTLCCTNDREEIERGLFEYCKKIKCAGIILTGQTRLKRIDTEIPVVCVDAAEGLEGDFYEVTSDNAMAIRMLLEHLFRLNHKKIAFISGRQSNSCGQVREQAFRSVMEEHGLPVAEEYIFGGDFSVKSGFDAFEYFYAMPEMPTAVVAANDSMAKGFLIRAHSFGVSIPKDISVCGVDSVCDDVFFPKITSARQDTDRIALETYRYIRGAAQTPPPARTVLPVTFSFGDTCYRL